jgi:prepilin-type N-terminal cleavage/methylation domain-containing protein
MERQQGLTLVELIAVVVVLAILLGVAIPSYVRTKERGYYRAAEMILKTIYSGERAYCFTKTPVGARNYYVVTHNTPNYDEPNARWDAIFMDNPNLGSTGIRYVISGVAGGSTCDAATFTATATRLGSGSCNGKTASINQSSPDPTGDAAWEEGTC